MNQILVEHARSEYLVEMTQKPPPMKYGWAVVAALATVLTMFVAREMQTGIAYHKTGGPSYRSIQPGMFWFEIVFQAGLALLVWWCAYKVWRRANRS